MFVLEQFHKFATADPGKLAVVYNGRPVTFAAYWRYIEACRRSLLPQLPAQGLVVLLIDSLLEGWIFSLAIRSLGLDVAVVASAEQAALFEDHDVVAVISLAGETRPPATGLAAAKRLSLSAPSRIAVADDEPLPPLPADIGGGGQIRLTSGTTGVSKILLGYGGQTKNAIEQRADSYGELGDKIRQQGPDSIVNVLNFGLWTAGGLSRPMFTWCQGGAVVMRAGLDVERTFDWPGITHCSATPANLTYLMSLPEGAFPYCPDMQLIVGTGRVTPALAREVRRRLTPRMLITLASSEAGGWARTVVESDADLRWYRLVPNRRVEVVDDAGKPLAPGLLGRVRVHLPNPDRSHYLGDPEATAAHFSDNWFYPGDLGVLDGAGRLALYGRTTDVVNINGDKYATEPWESAIQEALECDGVCILSGSWGSESEDLHVFIETRRPIPAQTLTDAVRETLSGFPGAHVHVVDALPRTLTGKVQRIELSKQLHAGAYR